MSQTTANTTNTANTANTTSTTTAIHAAIHAANWFEIPVANMDRAQAFYEAVLGQALRREDLGPQTLAVLPYTEPGAGGALMASPWAKPSAHGTLVYLNVVPNLDAAVARAMAAGASIAAERVDLPDGMGSFVHILDSEGNRVGLHSNVG